MLLRAIPSVFLLLFLSVSPAVFAQQEANDSGAGSNWSDDLSDDWGDSWDDDWGETTDSSDSSPWIKRYFLDAGYGVFSKDNPVSSAQSLAEIRGQLSTSRYFDAWFFSSKFDFVADDVDEEFHLEARELYIERTFATNWTFKAGQQILTWGTGDFVFLNDFFPKDWQAMFSGRDDDYLKAPSASIKLGYYSSDIGIDMVLTPEFAADNYIDGDRFSYFQPGVGIVAAPPGIRVDEPSATLNNAQYFARVYKTVDGVEYAGYLYRGFYTQPLGFSPVLGRNVFPRLNSYGLSFRLPWAGGLANMEWAWQTSVDDQDGVDPLVPNTKLQWLTGFEREVARNLTLGTQFLLTWTKDYDEQQQAAPQPEINPDEYHKLVTLRLTHMAFQQKLTSSLFVFYSPDAEDYYLKPKVSWRQNDNWFYVLGANLFGGEEQYTQWGQFEDNSNVYFRVKYSF